MFNSGYLEDSKPSISLSALSGSPAEPVRKRKSREVILHGVTLCVLVRHLPAALDDDEKQESGQSVDACHRLSFWNKDGEKKNLLRLFHITTLE